MGTAATGTGMLAIAMATGAVTAMDVATVGTPATGTGSVATETDSVATGMAAATAGTAGTGMGIAVTVDPIVWRIQAGGRRGARPSVAL